MRRAKGENGTPAGEKGNISYAADLARPRGRFRGYKLTMRPSFVVLTVLSAVLAAALGVARHDARYFTRMALADLASARLPGKHLASSVDELNIARALDHYVRETAEAGDAAGGGARPARLGAISALASRDAGQALGIVEMEAAAVLCATPDPAAVELGYQQIIEARPESALLRYRYAAYLLTRLQTLARRHPGYRLPSQDAVAQADDAVEDGAAAAEMREAQGLVIEARRQLREVMRIDQHNSLPAYEMAYSYLVFNQFDEAAEYLQMALAGPEFDAGDGAVLSGAARAVTAAGIPPLEGLGAVHRVAQVAPSYMSGRMEQMTAQMLSERMIERLGLSGGDYGAHLAVFEDLSEKLFHTAGVLRQMQGSFITSGLLWRKMLAEAEEMGDEELRGVARRQLAQASYRYLMVGWERAAAGLMPQQSVLELDTPVDLRLGFSPKASWIARALFMLAAIIALPAAALALLSPGARFARQPCGALLVLLVFTCLAYSATFYSTARERAATGKSLERRLRLLCEGPSTVRQNGQAAAPGEFRIEIPKAMLFTFDYTMQAGRVLAYVGTRESYDALIEPLSSPSLVRPVELIAVLEEATGTDLGRKAAGRPIGGKESVEAWQNWWRENRASFPETAGRGASAGATGGA